MVALYVILLLSVLAVVGTAGVLYLRVRRLAKASESQFRRALEEVPEPHDPETHEHSTAAAETEVAQ